MHTAGERGAGPAIAAPPEEAARSLENNPKLLREMLQDMERQDPRYRPARYWRQKQAHLVRWLLHQDLNTFRSYHAPLRAFGGGADAISAAEYQALEQRVLSAIPVRGLNALLLRLRDRLPAWSELINLFIPTVHLANLACRSQFGRRLLVDALSRYDREDSRIRAFSDRRLGSPSDAVEWEGRCYTPNLFAKVAEYLLASRHYDFSSVQRVLEVGPGYGCQMEVLLSANPAMRGCLIEIPPQLYVTQQYLHARFPGQVCRYHDAKAQGVARALERHRVVCLAPWQIEEIPADSCDLFWNQCSLQEMSPAIVRNYARQVQRITTRALYLVNAIRGDVEEPADRRTHTAYDEYLEFFDEFRLAWFEDQGGKRHGVFLRHER